MTLSLWDTAGQEGFDQIRKLCYENTNCFVVCFSVTDTISFNNVRNKWIGELRANQPTAKILLVGTKADLRGSQANTNANAGGKDEDLRIKEVS